MPTGPGFNFFPSPPPPAGPDYTVRTPWTRPTDWRALPEVTSTDQKLVGLFAVWPGTGNVVAMTCRGAYNVDWGDGSSENVADNTLVNHTYDYADADLAGTECSRGYKQAIIVVTPQGGSNLTSIVLDVLPTVPTGVVSGTSVGWLDIVISSSLLTTLTLFKTGNVLAYILEKVTIISHGLTTTGGANLFSNLQALQSVPLFDTSALTSMANMFTGCQSLQTVPLFNTSAVTTMASMFSSCQNLQTVPLFNTSAVTTMASMFSNCQSLRTVPLFDTSAVTTSMASMFNACYSVQSVPLFNTTKVTSMANMFYGCYSLQTVPLFNTVAVTNMSAMFQGCSALITVPLFDTTAVTTSMANMFNACYSLETVPLFNTANVTSMASMFQNCYSLRSVPLFNTALVNNMTSMFVSCSTIQTLPLFNTASVAANGMATMLSRCSSLQVVPAFVTTSSQKMGGMFQYCYALTYIPPISAAAVASTANLASIFGTCPSLSNAVLTGAKYAVDLTSCRFPTTEIETLMDALGAGVSSPVLTLTGNIGAPTEISKASSGTTSGSTTITPPNTTSLAIGMEVRGTGISDAVAVTTQDTGDTVTRNAHGIPDGTRISFATIVTTTGIVVNTPYYVVNGATNTFQVSDALGGSAKALTTDGSGTIIYGTTVTQLSPDVLISIPASANGTVTLYFAVLKRSKARLHGFTVTG